MKALPIEQAALASRAAGLRDFIELAKPRVVALIVFCALIGMLLVPDAALQWPALLAGLIGIGLVAMGAAVLNCLAERGRDALMVRTRHRATARGEVGSLAALGFAMALALPGLALLWVGTNPLTAWLTAATLIGYSLIYTVILKPLTSQNIVIGGAAGAMPPLLGWAAMTGEVSAQALLLFLIIFIWTPPHFWSLALYRRDDYARAGLPMLPVTHGMAYTQLQIVLYTWLLLAVVLLPFAARMSGWLYLLIAGLLSLRFIQHAHGLQRDYSDARARAAFKFSIWYLFGIFSALLLDRHVT